MALLGTITVTLKNIPAEIVAKHPDLRWIGEGANPNEIRDWPLETIGHDNQTVTIEGGKLLHPRFPPKGHFQLQVSNPWSILTISPSLTWRSGADYTWDVGNSQLTEGTLPTTTPPGNGTTPTPQPQPGFDWSNLFNSLTQPIAGVPLPAPLNEPIVLIPGAFIVYKLLFGRRGLLR